jgi:hypothetical protein
MSKRVLMVIAVIVMIVVAGLVVTMKRALKAGAEARDPDVAAPRITPPPASKP